MTRFLKSIQNRISSILQNFTTATGRLHRRNIVIAVGLIVGVPFLLTTLSLQERVITLDTDVFVYGGTLGGASSALTLAEEDIDVVIVSDTPHFGGQAVDVGLSAFDESGRGWENYGVYAQLKQYVKDKYQIEDKRNFGPGNAVVGSLATLPGDVEEFFLSRFSELQPLSFFSDYELMSVTKDEFGTYTEAELFNEKERIRLIIRYQYLIDGTQTGKLIAKTGTDYNIGFDKQEETQEPSAMTEQVRDYFINGYTNREKQHGKLGNRVQSVSAMLPVYDQGYNGVYVDELALESDCWEKDTTKPYINSGSVLVAQKPGCTLTIKLQPEFTDTYDLYFINHGNQSLDAALTLDGNEHSYNFVKTNIGGQSMYNLGSFYLSNMQEVSLKIKAPAGGHKVEGVILQKTNLHQQPFVLNSPLNQRHGFTSAKLKNFVADIYFSSEADLSEVQAVKLNGVALPITKTGPQSYLAQSVLLSQERNFFDFSSKAKSDATKQVMILPVEAAFSGEVTFGYNDAVQYGEWQPGVSPDGQENFVSRGESLIQWEVTATQTANYIFLLDWFPFWDRTTRASIKVFDAETDEMIGRSVFSQRFKPREQQVPIMTTELEKGKSYKVRFENFEENKVLDFAELSMVPITDSNFIYVNDTNLNLSTNKYEGVYDLWLLPAEEQTAAITKDGSTYNVPIPNTTAFTIAGRFFVHERSTDRVSADKTMQVLLIPNYRANSYVKEVNLSEQNYVDIRRLIPGNYMMTTNFDRELVFGELKAGNAPDIEAKREIPTYRAEDGQITTTDAIHHDGSLFQIGFTGLVGEPQGKLYFYDEIPGSYNTQQFNYSFPLLAETDPDRPIFEKQTFFNFRNLISPQNLLNREWELPFEDLIATNTLGLSVAATPFNDYAPVTANNIDSEELTESAKRFSYTYYYWIRYDSLVNSKTAGCNLSDELRCDPRRIALASTIYGNDDGFAGSIYIREARRLVTTDPITEQEVTLKYLDCGKDQCSQSTCYDYKEGATRCIAAAKDQDAALFSDALSAVYYDLDFHSYFSRLEEIRGVERDLLSFLRDEKFLSENGQIIFERYAKSKPASVTIGSLIPADHSNIFPAATNFGTTQITNSYFRTHHIEIAVGSSAGNLVAFLINNDLTPKDLDNNAELQRQFQTELIKKGVILYPIDQVDNFDSLLVQAVQKLILEDQLPVTVELQGTATVLYKVDTGEQISARDAELQKVILPNLESLADMRDLVNAFVPEDSDLSNQELKDLGLELGVINWSDRDKAPAAVLEMVPTRASLFKAVYLDQYAQTD